MLAVLPLRLPADVKEASGSFRRLLWDNSNFVSGDAGTFSEGLGLLTGEMNDLWSRAALMLWLLFTVERRPLPRSDWDRRAMVLGGTKDLERDIFFFFCREWDRSFCFLEGRMDRLVRLGVDIVGLGAMFPNADSSFAVR